MLHNFLRITFFLLLALPFGAIPSKAADDAAPLRIIVPTPPGGANDGVARALQGPLEKSLGRTVIVEYKPGAAGSIGPAFVARSKPDGNTLLLHNNAVLINTLVSRNAGYAISDLKMVAIAGVSTLYLMANAAVPARNTKELLDYLAAQSEPVAYASTGVGSVGHLAMERFASLAKVKLLHVPYAGAGPFMVALTTGEVKIVMTTFSPGLKGQVAAGKIRLLGIAAAAPSPSAPEVRPISEVVPGIRQDAWFGLLAPSGTPGAVVERISNAVGQALATDEVRSRLLSFGLQPNYIGTEQSAKLIAEETVGWKDVIRELNISRD